MVEGTKRLMKLELKGNQISCELVGSTCLTVSACRRSWRLLRSCMWTLTIWRNCPCAVHRVSAQIHVRKLDVSGADSISVTFVGLCLETRNKLTKMMPHSCLETGLAAHRSSSGLQVWASCLHLADFAGSVRQRFTSSSLLLLTNCRGLVFLWFWYNTMKA